MRLRFKLYAMILPLIAIVSILSGYHSFQQSYAALGRIANRHLAFKAEQLRDFSYSEWEVIVKLGLQGKAEYRAAMEKSILSYAGSLLRGDSELIVALDGQGSVKAAVGKGAVPESGRAGTDGTPLADGWFSGTFLGEKRVGVVFDFSPLGWKVAVTDLEPSFFSDLDVMRAGFITINAAAMAALFGLLTFFLRYVMKPVERLSRAIREIGAAEDLTRRAEIESRDEIGSLAEEFNAMLARLESGYEALGRSRDSERSALRAVTQREEETIMVLGRVSDFRDVDTGRHVKRIGELSALFMRLLGHEAETQELLRRSSLLHDIGKIGIPDSILLKPTKLNAEEYEVVKRHTTLGYELLKGAQGIILTQGAIIALTHHEKWDGSGYPRGLAGEAIPLPGRVVGILDVFDALISRRSYKDAWSMEKARDYMAENRGTQFDPGLIDVFIEHFDEFRALAEEIGVQSDDDRTEEAIEP